VKTHPNFLLLICILPFLAWSAWRPYDALTWWLEVTPVFLAFAALFIAQAKSGWRFSNMALVLTGLHMVILIVGGHYTYARVPLGNWAAETFHLARNDYDRLGHLAQGLVPAVICREIFIRLRVITHRGWLGFCVVCVCLAISATYELVECAAALVSAEAADSFLGTQGDHWDTQSDMFLALVGALVTVLLLARTHDRSMAKVA
jgi:putative membrane protein